MKGAKGAASGGLTGLLNVEGLSDLNVHGTLSGGWRECCTIQAINWTPWWGGDYETKVRDPETLKPTSRPTSETLKGIVRWILRLALATHEGGGHARLDEILAPYYGGIIRLSPQGGGSEVEAHLDSLVSIRVASRVKDDSNKLQRLKEIIDNLWKLESEYRRLNNKEIRNKINELLLKEAFNGGVNAILGVSRYELATMAKVDERRQSRLRLIPILPGHVELEISVRVKRIPAGAGLDGLLCKLTVYAIVYALEVRGIGRGASRGFGRFKVEGAKCPAEEHLEVEIKDLAGRLVDPSKVRDAITDIHRRLVEGARALAVEENYRRALAAVGAGREPTWRIRQGGKGLVARLAEPLENLRGCLTDYGGCTEVRVIDDALHPAPVPIAYMDRDEVRPRRVKAGDVYDALSAIGKAVLKSTWKKYSLNTVTKPGVGFHTWILGLPRWQQNTGYALLPGNYCKRKSENDLCSDNCCVSQDKLKPNRRVHQRQSTPEGRRMSSIILYPLPNSTTIVIIAYASLGDHKLILSGSGSEWKIKLYHVGRHGKPKAKGRHVVGVAFAASRNRIDAPDNKCISDTVKKYECRGDWPAGVVYPDRVEKANSPDDIVALVYESALGFLEHLLGGRLE